jgi:hypothetical protein
MSRKCFSDCPPLPVRWAGARVKLPVEDERSTTDVECAIDSARMGVDDIFRPAPR